MKYYTYETDRNAITVTKYTKQYSQPEDTGGRTAVDDQYLDVEINDSGDGHYYVIKTERWAFDSIDDLVGVIEDFVKGIEFDA